jgi:sugar/nucleoside kinase (ribokinase family)
MQHVIGIGNALVDIMISIPGDDWLERFRLPKGSMTHVATATVETILSETAALPRVRTTGGSAANTIHGLARLGTATSYVGKTGNDELGTFYTSDMTVNGISPRILHGQAATGRAIALVSPDGERSFAVFLGSAIELAAADLQDTFFAGCHICHIEGYLAQNHDLIERAVGTADTAGLQVSFDLASYNVVRENRDFLRSIVKRHVDILFANEEEAAEFSGSKDPETALAIMTEYAPIAIVKVGAKGSLAAQAGKVYKIACVPAKVVDTTGAGDLYASGFLYGLCQDRTLDICGQMGSILAGKVVEVIGAKLSDDQWHEVKPRIAAL